VKNHCANGEAQAAFKQKPQQTAGQIAATITARRKGSVAKFLEVAPLTIYLQLPRQGVTPYVDDRSGPAPQGTALLRAMNFQER